MALACGLLAPAPGSAVSGSTRIASIAPSSGHALAGFALDRERLALAEDPVAAGACPLVRLVHVGEGSGTSLTRPNGPTCSFGGRFWVRPGARAIGVALDKALWVLRSGSEAVAVKSSPREQEVVLARVRGIVPGRGPFLGPVVATNWLRLFGWYTRGPEGTLRGRVVSGNSRTLWAARGPVPPLGLDDEEHAVSVGSAGAIAMWHAHGARYGRVPAARAKAAALDEGLVDVLRVDRPRLDVRDLSGRVVASWPVAPEAAPLLDADGGVAVYLSGRDVHELDLGSGRDRVVASAPAGTALLDAQIERRLLVYAYRGPADPRGTVVLLSR